jgi:hypothetical protein
MCRRGTMFRRLSGVTEKILLSPTKYGSIAVSFAQSVLLVTQDWQARVQRSYTPRTEGVLALQSQFSHIDDSLRELGKLCHCVLPPPQTPVDKERQESETCCRTPRSGPTFAVVRPGLEIRFPLAITPPCSLGDAATTLVRRVFRFIDLLDWIPCPGKGI